jgi:hypothetical protein
MRGRSPAIVAEQIRCDASATQFEPARSASPGLRPGRPAMTEPGFARGPVPRSAPFSSRRCAVFVRTLEKGAHLRRNRRHFPRCALFEKGEHLRTTCAPSAGPRPCTRCRSRVKSCRHLLRPRSHCGVSKRTSYTNSPSPRAMAHCSAPVQGRALVESRLARQGHPTPVTPFWSVASKN